MIPQAPFIQPCLWYNFSLPQLEGFREPPNLCPCKATGSSLGDQQWHHHSSVLQITPRSWWQTKGQVPDIVVGQQELCGCHQVHLQCPGGENRSFSDEKTTWKWFWASLLKSEVGRFLWLSGGCPSALSLAKDRDRGFQSTGGLWLALVPQNFSRSLTASANCTEKDSLPNCHRTALKVEGGAVPTLTSENGAFTGSPSLLL